MAVEVQDVLAAHGEEFLATHALTPQQRRAYDDMLACRTAELGGHVDRCEGCGHELISYNSCRNRHCPKCQAMRRERWVAREGCDLLDVGYYHVVFTVPHELGCVFWRNQREMYNLLFRCAWATVAEFAADRKWLGARTGAVAVLHTWGRKLQYHPHVHMVVPSGGLTDRGTWRRTGSRFFAPVRAMSKVFRAKLLEGVRALAPALDLGGCASHLADDGALGSLVSELFERPWVVYCKRPFADAGRVLAYLGRYTHRVAISNARIKSLEGGVVTFEYRDSRDGRVRECRMAAVEFIRRLLMHVLPKGLCKIRHYGILASRGKRERMALCRRLTSTPAPAPDAATLLRRMLGRDPTVCPKCGKTLLPMVRMLGPMLC
ncbi:MAG: IS91 family transposase [Atopobiaceae bacterium]|nr:IS91 family transposase [Atopobiaceae bacterium]